MTSTSSKRKTCQTCKKRKRIGDFHRNVRTADGFNGVCKICNIEKSKAWYAANCERAKQRTRSNYEANREAYKLRAKRWAKKNKKARKEIVHAHDRRRRERLKLAVCEAYGGAFCACCGEDELIFLTVDHVDNNGAKHRKIVNGLALYEWLVEKRFPKGFQIMCRNCNWGKHVCGGVCPHKLKAGK